MKYIAFNCQGTLLSVFRIHHCCITTIRAKMSTITQSDILDVSYLQTGCVILLVSMLQWLHAGVSFYKECIKEPGNSGLRTRSRIEEQLTRSDPSKD
ncbi:hypothetical protein P3L10_033396 [Capsicum annuum]